MWLKKRCDDLWMAAPPLKTKDDYKKGQRQQRQKTLYIRINARQ